MLYYTFKHPGNVGMVDPCLFYKKKNPGIIPGIFCAIWPRQYPRYDSDHGRMAIK